MPSTRSSDTLASVTTSLAAQAWGRERGRLIGIAYRMLGDLGEAEDVASDVAESALTAERRGDDVRSWPAWLTTACVRRSIDRVRALAARRETYPGPWLPEPVSPDRLPDEVAATRELLSLTLLHLAEQLRPEARAALVLHRAFGMTAREIGEILERSPAAVRQSISRAERTLRIAPGDPAPRPADAAALGRLVAAIETGDVAQVLALLDDDVVLWSDGGGRVSAARRPIVGADAVARFILGVLDKAVRAGTPTTLAPLVVNGEAALDLRRPGRRDVVVLELTAEGRVRGVRQVSNPDKLTRV